MSDPFLEQRIIEHEGIKKSVYKDTLGYDTIGIGFCVDARLNVGLSVEECMLILRSRIANLEKNLSQYGWYKIQDVPRKGVLIELAYNMGVAGLLKFERFLAFMQERKPSEAAKELMDSKWYGQVGKSRSNDILKRLREGTYGR